MKHPEELVDKAARQIAGVDEHAWELLAEYVRRDARETAHAVLDAVAPAIREAALNEAATAIERRRLRRRRNWLRRHRWSGETEARWSQGMWDAAGLVRRMAAQQREEQADGR